MESSIEVAIDFSIFQTLFDATTVYLNLFVLIPWLLSKHGKTTYIIGVIITLLILSFLVESINLYGLLNGMGHDFDLGPNMYTVETIYSAFMEYALFMIISFLYWYFTRHKEEQQKTLQFQNEKLKAELQVLKSQISPHFLFNSLNNIYSLVIQKNDNAAIMIEKLSDILRYIIYEGTKEKVSLQSEVLLLKNYIELQLLRKIRNEQAIRYTIHGNFSEKMIAPLLLINIVENCFKHSNIGSSEDSFLHIDLSLEEDTLTLKTQNTFTPNHKKKGIGLQNLRRQLVQIYPSSHSLTIDSTQNIFTIELILHLDE